MIAYCIVLDEEREKSHGKSEPTFTVVWRCTDVTPAGALVKSFDYLPTEEEHARHGGKIRNRTVSLAITHIWPTFGRRLRAKGRVIEKQEKQDGNC